MFRIRTVVEVGSGRYSSCLGNPTSKVDCLIQQGIVYTQAGTHGPKSYQTFKTMKVNRRPGEAHESISVVI